MELLQEAFVADDTYVVVPRCFSISIQGANKAELNQGR